ncbi:MAG: SUMF1/EgtB/PvdO family nonheme iron enzyme [Deltaproteobacteria bacterium]|nr:SUMF1/EgtB/PvdO family nonheme iron enzyme [Deltaproteobacteria bacterium]
MKPKDLLCAFLFAFAPAALLAAPLEPSPAAGAAPGMAEPQAGAFKVRRLMGVLVVLTEPGEVEAVIDGRPAGAPTPFEVRVTAGEHTVTFLYGGRRIERRVDVPVDGKETLRVDLEAASAAQRAAEEAAEARRREEAEQVKRFERAAAELERDMALVRGGAFRMGGRGNPDEQPAHEVALSDFRLGRFEVTQAQWAAGMASTPSRRQDCDRCPVENVSWDDVQLFLQRLNEKTGGSYRLPTEAEWEYAARSGGREDAWSGTSAEGELGAYAWYEANSSYGPHAVGQKKPNGLGLYDLTGNVSEWCQDWYGERYYAESARQDPKGPPSGNRRVLRGGAWNNIPSFARTGLRTRQLPIARFNFAGFRLAAPPAGGRGPDQ